MAEALLPLCRVFLVSIVVSEGENGSNSHWAVWGVSGTIFFGEAASSSPQAELLRAKAVISQISDRGVTRFILMLLSRVIVFIRAIRGSLYWMNHEAKIAY